MGDSGLCTLFSWDTKDMDILDDKSSIMSTVGTTTPALPTKQTYLNYCLGSSGETESLKSASSASDASSTKSPKSEITLNALQHEQNTLIEQRIHDRTNNLRNMNSVNTPPWTPYNNYLHRMYPNVELNTTMPVTGPCLLTNPINSCMFGPNRTTQWFNRTNLPSDPWNNDYSQDPTMRSRPCFSSHQTRELEREFTLCQYVTRRRRIELAYSLNLTEKQIKTWFQNRRVKERKQKKNSSESAEHEQQNS